MLKNAKFYDFCAKSPKIGFDHPNSINIPLHLPGSGTGGPKSAPKCIFDGISWFPAKMPKIHKSCLKTCFWRCWRSGYRVATDFPAARPRSGTSKNQWFCVLLSQKKSSALKFFASRSFMFWKYFLRGIISFCTFHQTIWIHCSIWWFLSQNLKFHHFHEISAKMYVASKSWFCLKMHFFLQKMHICAKSAFWALPNHP